MGKPRRSRDPKKQQSATSVPSTETEAAGAGDNRNVSGRPLLVDQHVPQPKRAKRQDKWADEMAQCALPDPSINPKRHALFKHFNTALLVHGVFFAWARNRYRLWSGISLPLTLPLEAIDLDQLYEDACSRAGTLKVKFAAESKSEDGNEAVDAAAGGSVTMLDVPLLVAARVLLGSTWNKQIRQTVHQRLAQCRGNHHPALGRFRTPSLLLLPSLGPHCKSPIAAFAINEDALDCPFTLEPIDRLAVPPIKKEPAVVAPIHNHTPPAPASSFAFKSVPPSSPSKSQPKLTVFSSDSEPEKAPSSSYVWSDSDSPSHVGFSDPPTLKPELDRPLPITQQNAAESSRNSSASKPPLVITDSHSDADSDAAHSSYACSDSSSSTSDTDSLDPSASDSSQSDTDAEAIDAAQGRTFDLIFPTPAHSTTPPPSPPPPAASRSAAPAPRSPKLLPRPATNKKEWYQATATFNRALTVYTLLFGYALQTHAPGSRVPIATATHSHDFGIFASALFQFAHENLDLPVPYIVVHKDGVDFTHEPLADVLYTLYGRKERRRLLIKGIKEFVHGAVTGDIVGVPAVQLTAVVPLVRDAAGEAGVWVLNWEAHRTPYVRGVSRTPQAALARPLVSSSKSSRASSSHAAAAHDRVPLVFAASSIKLTGDPKSESESESDSDDDDIQDDPLPPAHRPSKKRSLPVDSDDAGTDADTEDDSLPPPAQRPRLVTPVVLIPLQPPRPKTQTPPPSHLPPPPPARAASSSCSRASTSSFSSTSTAPHAPPAPPSSRSPLVTTSTTSSAPMDRDHARHLAQLTMMRLQLRQSHPWATDAWYHQLKDSMHAIANTGLTMHSLRRCAEVTALQLAGAGADAGADADADAGGANKMVAQVVAYTLVERKYPGIAFEYVDALFEAAGEMGVPVNAETLDMCADMLMEG